MRSRPAGGSPPISGRGRARRVGRGYAQQSGGRISQARCRRRPGSAAISERSTGRGRARPGGSEMVESHPENRRRVAADRRAGERLVDVAVRSAGAGWRGSVAGRCRVPTCVTSSPRDPLLFADFRAKSALSVSLRTAGADPNLSKGAPSTRPFAAGEASRQRPSASPSKRSSVCRTRYRVRCSRTYLPSRTNLPGSAVLVPGAGCSRRVARPPGRTGPAALVTAVRSWRRGMTSRAERCALAGAPDMTEAWLHSAAPGHR